MKNTHHIARRHLDKRFQTMSPEVVALLTPPTKGWVKAIREALGLTLAQLALKLGVSATRVTTIEQGECKGSVTLATMERMAQALGCQFVYAFIPHESLQSIVESQAKRKADVLLKQIGHTMHLEDQSTTTEEFEIQRKQLLDDLLAGKSARLWDEA